MSSYNTGLYVHVFEGRDGSVERADPVGLLDDIQELTFSSIYPGGLYETCSFAIPTTLPRARFPVKHGDRLQVADGLTVVWEGLVSTITNDVDRMSVEATGAWGEVAEKRTIMKAWADDRVSDPPWHDLLASSAFRKCQVSHSDDAIVFIPQRKEWTSGEVMDVQYIAPGSGYGHGIAKLEYDVSFEEDVQAWRLIIHNATAGTNTVTYSTSTTLTGQSTTWGTPPTQIRFRMSAASTHTPSATGDIHGEFSNLMAYAEWYSSSPTTVSEGTLNLTELCYDIIGFLADYVSTNTAFVDSNTLDIRPFVAPVPTPVTEVLVDAAARGSSTDSRWAVYFRESALVTGEVLPVMVVEEYPALTDAEYRVFYEDPELEDLGLQWSTEGLYNWINVEFADTQGLPGRVNPNGVSTLKDQDSIDAYGRRDYSLSIGTADITQATEAGERFLAAHKDPQWYVSKPISVTGTIRTSSGIEVPVSRVRAGERITVGSYLDDGSGTWLTFLINRTSYNDDARTMQITAGIPALMLGEAILR